MFGFDIGVGQCVGVTNRPRVRRSGPVSSIAQARAIRHQTEAVSPRAHDLWQIENVKDSCPGGRAWMLSESLTSPDWIAGRSKSDPSVGCRGKHFNYGRLRSRGPAAVARAVGSGRETTTSQPSRKPLPHTRCSTPTVPACPASTCDGTPRGAQARSRRPKSLTRPLAACHLLPIVQLTPKALFYLALSRSDHLARPPGVRSSESGALSGQVLCHCVPTTRRSGTPARDMIAVLNLSAVALAHHAAFRC